MQIKKIARLYIFAKKEHQEKLDKSLTEAGICHVSCKRADMNGNAMFLVADKDVQKGRYLI